MLCNLRDKNSGVNVPEVQARRATLLVVEDEVGLLEILTINLEAAGYRVLPATDGLQALELFEAQKPDLVLLDLKLPDISGFRLLDLFRQGTRVPIIILTAYAFQEVEIVAEAGVEGFITKPFDPKQVIALVDFVLSRAITAKLEES